jgi:hypothetical protein
MQKIILIQNTHYHFETLISLYQMLTNIGYDVYIYRYLLDFYGQTNFLAINNAKIADDAILKQCQIAIFISTYPNPQVSRENAIPNYLDIFDSIDTKYLYITHRFKNLSDYTNKESNINIGNSLSLSPISSNIGLDYIYLNNYIIQPNYCFEPNKLKLTIQGHFEFKHRDVKLLFDSLRVLDLKKINKKIQINFVGTKLNTINNLITDITDIEINKYENVSEHDFYNILNNSTDFILSLLNPTIKNQTYAIERYSSNFNHATALEKPILCHQYFKDIYKIPGIYYTSDTFQQSLIELIYYTDNSKYNNFIKQFEDVKSFMDQHNKIIFNKKFKKLILS